MNCIPEIETSILLYVCFKESIQRIISLMMEGSLDTDKTKGVGNMSCFAQLRVITSWLNQNLEMET